MSAKWRDKKKSSMRHRFDETVLLNDSISTSKRESVWQNERKEPRKKATKEERDNNKNKKNYLIIFN